MDFYEYTDRIIKYISSKTYRYFSKAKSSVFGFDELNVMSYTKDMYEKLEKITEEAYVLLAEQIYNRNALKKGLPGVAGKGGKTEDWVDEFLLEYNPLTKYVFRHEAERKAARMAEGVIASRTKSDAIGEIDRSMRLWSQQTNTYADQITDAAAIKAWTDSGVELLKWVCVKDNKCCKECNRRDGKIYPIGHLPDKPHYNCRCHWVPVIKK